MDLICAQCDAPIPSQHINVQTDLAKCPACGSVHKASKLISKREWDLATQLYPPSGSKIDIYELEDGDVEITLPPKGLNGGIAFLAIFTVFWLSFVAVWTTFAAMGTIFMALFSIPFWLVGFGMGFSVLNAIWEKQVIRIERNSLRLQKKRPVLSKDSRLAFSEIDAIERKEINAKDSLTDWNKINSISLAQSNRTGANNETPEVPVIKAGINEYPFFEHISKEEAMWLIYTLKDLIREPQAGASRRSRPEALPEEMFDAPDTLEDPDLDFDGSDRLMN